MSNSFSHQIYKFRALWSAGVIAFAFTWWYAFAADAWWLFFASYVWARINLFLGIQIALHRYFCHRSFETSAVKHRFLLWFSILSGEGSPISWATHHRHHHRYSDQAQDLHSPYESKLLSMFLWQIKPVNWWLETKKIRTMPRDLLRDKEIRFVDANYYNIWLALILLTTLLAGWKATVFFLLAPVGWAVFDSILSNFLSHWKFPGSYRNFETDDRSYNNLWIAYYLGGEGLHNNHHNDQSLYNQAVKPGEFDSAGWVVEKFFLPKNV